MVHNMVHNMKKTEQILTLSKRASERISLCDSDDPYHWSQIEIRH